jgi:hypothetical protein
MYLPTWILRHSSVPVSLCGGSWRGGNSSQARQHWAKCSYFAAKRPNVQTVEVEPKEREVPFWEITV